MYCLKGGVKLEMNNRKTNGKLPNTCRLNSTLLNNIWVKEHVSEDI